MEGRACNYATVGSNFDSSSLQIEYQELHHKFLKQENKIMNNDPRGTRGKCARLQNLVKK